MTGTSSQGEPQAHLSIDGLEHPVVAFDCNHGFDVLGSAEVTIDTDGLPDPGAWLECPAMLVWSITGTAGTGDGAFCGEVTEVEQQPRDSGTRHTLTIEPRLARLAQTRSVRVFRQLDLAGLVTTLFRAHGLDEGDWRWALVGEYPARDWILQADESDLDFLRRQLAYYGVFTYTEIDGERDVTVFTDTNTDGGALGPVPIRYHPGAGMPEHLGDATTLSARQVSQPPPAGYHVAPDPPPERPFARPGDVERVYHRPAPGDARSAAQQGALADAAEAARNTIHLAGAIAHLAPGGHLSLAGELPAGLEGTYLVTHARVRFQSASRIDNRDPSMLEGAIDALALAAPYRPAPPPLPTVPTVLAARIEADTATQALVDAAGRYRARLDGDAQSHAHTEASPGLRARTPYASPADAPAGWHFPLRDGANVLITCLDGDPDRPCLIGFAPEADQPGPVTKDNATAHEVRTPAGNRFALDDTRDAEAVVIETFSGTCLTRLDAQSDEPFVRLACAQGAMALTSARDLTLEADADASERVGASRTTQVADSHRSETRDGAIRHQAQIGDAEVGAYQALATDSDGHSHWVAGGAVRIDAEDNARVTVDGDDGLQCKVSDGAVHVQAAERIEITGDGGGDIVVEQNGAGLAVLADGTVRLFGNAVSINAADGDVILDGPVEYEVPGDNEPSEAPEARPKAADAIGDLEDPAEATLRALGSHDGNWPALTDRSGRPSSTLALWYTTLALDPDKQAPITLVLKRTAGDATVELQRIEDTPATPDGVHDVAMPAPTIADQPVALRTANDEVDDIAVEALPADERPSLAQALRPVRALDIELAENSQGEPPLRSAFLALEDVDGEHHYAQVRDGRGHFVAVPVGRFRLWGEDVEGNSLAIVSINGLATVPGVRSWLREEDLTTIAGSLRLRTLPTPILVNIRRDDDPASNPGKREDDQLTTEELDYFKRQGNNATIIVHGYNVALGEYGPGLQGEAPAPQSGPRPGPPTVDLVTTGDTSHAHIDPQQMRQTLSASQGGQVMQTDPNDADELNGNGARSWLTAMEGQLNRAANGGTLDYTRYQRLIGVTWSGDTAASYAFWRSELNANAAGRRLVRLLIQLADAGVAVNLITHSLGARVALTALNLIGEMGERGHRPAEAVVEQCILWQPAVSENALADEPQHDISALEHEHFPAAHKAAGRFVVLHSEHDNVLGDENALTEGAGNPIEKVGQAVGGLYSIKYITGDFLGPRYLEQAGVDLSYAPYSASLAQHHLQVQQVPQRLRREAERVAPAPAHAQGERPLPALELLLPWAREYRFTQAELDRIEARLLEVLQQPGLPDVPNEVAPAMGWKGPNLQEPRTFDLERAGILEIVDQAGLLYTHSGMKYPDETLFEEIVQKTLWTRYISRVGFGSYT